MSRMRATLGNRPLLALMLVLLVMAARMLVPAGFMPERVGDRLTLALCTGHGPMAMAAASHGANNAHHHGAAKDTGKDGVQIDQPCGFGGLMLALGAGGDLPAPVVAMVLVALREVPPGTPSLAQPSDWLRPPLRGPPRVLPRPDSLAAKTGGIPN